MHFPVVKHISLKDTMTFTIFSPAYLSYSPYVKSTVTAPLVRILTDFLRCLMVIMMLLLMENIKFLIGSKMCLL